MPGFSVWALWAALGLAAGMASAQSGQLSLVRINMPQLANAGPERASAIVAVSPDGYVAFTQGYDPGDHLITVIDSTGRVVGRFGKTGSGPGEFQVIMLLHIDNTTVYTFGPGRLSAFSFSGKHLWTHQMPPSVGPLGIAGDSMDVVDVAGLVSGRQPMEVRRIATATGTGRVLVASTDPAMRALSRSVVD